LFTELQSEKGNVSMVERKTTLVHTEGVTGSIPVASTIPSLRKIKLLSLDPTTGSPALALALSRRFAKPAEARRRRNTQVTDLRV
jgi:hypothetical protein